MIETTEQFIERFKATGLDMLCEAQRRAEQSIPFYATVTGRSAWKNAAFGVAYDANRFFPDELLLGMDFTKAEERTLAMTTPSRPYQDRLRDLFQTVDPRWRLITMDCGEVIRNVPWPDSKLVFDLETLGHAFGNTIQSLDEWVSSFGVTPLRFQEPRPVRERQLWPGVKAQVEGERRLNPKRIAKDRMKKKLAKKSKRK